MGEPAESAVYAEAEKGELIRLPEATGTAAAVFTLHVKPAQQGDGITVRLYNASSTEQDIQIGSGLLRIAAA
ncbi:MAG: hypothetical protein M1546_19120 [Chloroflexi bacterium]|nr:hypothetical protein [Chloroflexota bacterium]